MSTNDTNPESPAEPRTTLFCAQSFGLLSFIGLFIMIGAIGMARALYMFAQPAHPKDVYVTPEALVIVFYVGLGAAILFGLGAFVLGVLENRNAATDATPPA